GNLSPTRAHRLLRLRHARLNESTFKGRQDYRRERLRILRGHSASDQAISNRLLPESERVLARLGERLRLGCSFQCNGAHGASSGEHGPRTLRRATRKQPEDARRSAAAFGEALRDARSDIL